jgi:hypothetical protein
MGAKLSLTLREVLRTMSRRIFGPKREEDESWRK